MNTKLSNGISYNNPMMAEEYAEYLIANGFHCYVMGDTLNFINGDKQIAIRHDTCDCFVFHPKEHGQENDKWVFDQSYTGISHLNLFGWMMLMHLMQVLTIKRFLSNANMLGKQTAIEAKFLVDNLLKILPVVK